MEGTRYGFYGITLLILTLGGCASSDNTSNSSGSDPNEVTVTNPSQSLEYYIRQLPGVSVDTSRDGVLIRGSSTFSGDVRALFVLDGRRVGRSLSGIKNRVNMYDVNKIRVLKGPATSNYGLDSGNGVIEIETRFN